MMKGEITVESVLGQGSTFKITLPAQVEKSASQVKSPVAHHNANVVDSPVAVNGSINTILVIDDDPTIQDILERHLTKEGYAVQIASDGETGLRLAKQLKPAVITLDVMMPGLDGWAVLTQLKADPELVDIPIIMLTMVRDKSIGYTLGAADYLTKPIDRNRLLHVISKYDLTKSQLPILLVEDDTLTRDMVRRTLEKEGWLVVEARNGREGLERVHDCVPQLILLDLMMPEMDGFRFVSELRNNSAWRTIPIIVVTAMDLTREDRLRLNGYVEHVLQKGAYNHEELLHEVCKLVANSCS
jgi:DNA-binding response OmpR family regulator